MNFKIRIGEFFTSFLLTAFLLTACSKASVAPHPKVEAAPQIVDRITLTSGAVLQGTIVEETPSKIRIKWQDGIVGFSPSEIQSIERNVSSDAETSAHGDLQMPTFDSEGGQNAWLPGAKHMVWLTNRERLGGTIKRVQDNVLTLRQNLDGGGAIEQDLELNRIEKIAFWPPIQENAEERLAETLKQYPSSAFLKEEYYNVVSTEQDPADLRRFLRTLNQFYHEFLLYYFDLVNLETPPGPLDVLMLGTREEFDAVLKEIGFNVKSNPIGFYEFKNKILVVYNARTNAGVDLNVAKGQAFRAEMDEMMKKNPYAHAQAEIAKEKSADQELKMMGDMLKQNIHVIRHEGGHQLFHLLGITPLEVYAGGWLIEGLAVYCETTPIGEVNDEWLMLLRYELEEGTLMPLSYLVNFARGTGFHRLDPSYAKVAYGESWAFIYFLMHEGYRNQFFEFLKSMRTQGADYGADDEKKLLEQHLGVVLSELEPKFMDFVKSLVQTHVNEKTYQTFRFNLLRSS